MGQHILVVPAVDLVLVHRTVPAQGHSVPHGEFMEVADMNVETYCGAVY